MEYTFKDWKDLMSDFCTKYGGTGQIVKRPSMGEPIEYYIYNMVFEYKGAYIILEQGAQTLAWKENLGLSYLVLNYELQINKFIYMSLTRRDWWDRLFFCESDTGNRAFDAIFIIRSSERKLGTRIFCNKKIADMFLHNMFLLLNVHTHKGKLQITLKDLRHKLYTEQELSDMLFCIQFIIDAVYN